MPLKDLIFGDMQRCLEKPDTAIPSEEVVRLMIEVYKKKGLLLPNTLFIKLNDVAGIINMLSQQRREGRVQLFIEFGTRSVLEQGVPDAIHYSGMDLFCDKNGNIKAFIVDHYNGHNFSSYVASKYDSISDNVHFIVAGGSPYQNDRTHCAFFTLWHLMLSAYDDELHRKLMLVPIPGHDTTLPRYSPLSWFDLAPKYNLATQSFKQLFSYVDFVKRKESLPDEEPSEVLTDAKFDICLSESLRPNPDDETLKIKNKKIEDLTVSFVRDVQFFLGEVTESSLIDICYGHHRVKSYLQAILNEGEELAHEFFKLVFSNQPLLNFMSYSEDKISGSEKLSKKLFELFSSPEFILLVQKKLIVPREWFEQLTSKRDGKSRVIDSDKMNTVNKNSKYLNHVCEAILVGSLNNINHEAIFDLFFSRRTHNIFVVESIRELYMTSQIDNEFLFKISRPDFARTPEAIACLKTMSVQEKKDFLAQNCSPVTISNVRSSSSSSSLFGAPESDEFEGIPQLTP